jgi:hypothetical protein
MLAELFGMASWQARGCEDFEDVASVGVSITHSLRCGLLIASPLLGLKRLLLGREGCKLPPPRWGVDKVLPRDTQRLRRGLLIPLLL